MIKKLAIGGGAVFVAWMVMDFIMHGVLLDASYKAASGTGVWRPEAEMKGGLIVFSVLVAAISFAMIYIKFIGNKSLSTGLQYGIWFGVAVGIGMGYGTYATSPIPYNVALTWFLGTIAEGAAGGALLGYLVKND